MMAGRVEEIEKVEWRISKADKLMKKIKVKINENFILKMITLRFIALMHTSTDNYANQIFSIRSNQYLDNHKLFFLVL